MKTVWQKKRTRGVLPVHRVHRRTVCLKSQVSWPVGLGFYSSFSLTTLSNEVLSARGASHESWKIKTK